MKNDWAIYYHGSGEWSVMEGQKTICRCFDENIARQIVAEHQLVEMFNRVKKDITDALR